MLLALPEIEFASLPLDPNVEVRLMAVVEPPVLVTTPEIAGAASPLDRALSEGQAEAERMLGQIEADVGQAVHRRVTVGRAGEEIARAANAPGVDLVVVGARGRGTFMRLLALLSVDTDARPVSQLVAMDGPVSCDMGA